jgi:hypothetical protein
MTDLEYFDLVMVTNYAFMRLETSHAQKERAKGLNRKRMTGFLVPYAPNAII